MRKLFLVAITAILVTTGWGCSQGEEGNLPTIQPTWEVYENQELGFAFQYPEEYTVNIKEVGDTATYMGREMDFILSLAVPTETAPESLFYVFYAQGTNLDQFKETIAGGYGEVAGAGEIIREETMNYGGLDLLLLENTTAMEGVSKTNYLTTVDGGLLIFSLFLGTEGSFEEILPTLRELK
ncbi:MAG: hypothetical protein ABIH67_03295 [Candidatus Uhrbacteria bacterium]